MVTLERDYRFYTTLVSRYSRKGEIGRKTEPTSLLEKETIDPRLIARTSLALISSKRSNALPVCFPFPCLSLSVDAVGERSRERAKFCALKITWQVKGVVVDGEVGKTHRLVFDTNRRIDE